MITAGICQTRQGQIPIQPGADVASEDSARPVTADLARDRTVLANERTYAAWLRTGLAALAAGLAIARFMNGAAPRGGVRAIATILILVSALIFHIGMWRHRHLHIAHRAVDVSTIPVWLTVLLSSALIAASVIALIMVWKVG